MSRGGVAAGPRRRGGAGPRHASDKPRPLLEVRLDDVRKARQAFLRSSARDEEERLACLRMQAEVNALVQQAAQKKRDQFLKERQERRQLSKQEKLRAKQEEEAEWAAQRGGEREQRPEWRGPRRQWRR